MLDNFKTNFYFLLCLIVSISVNSLHLKDLSVKSFTINPYCLRNARNSPCMNGCVRSAYCGKTADGFHSLNSAESKLVLELHNRFRESVAAGLHENISAALNDATEESTHAKKRRKRQDYEITFNEDEDELEDLSPPWRNITLPVYRKSSVKLPNAVNLKILSYDKEAQFFAGCYIKKCIFDHDNLRLTLDGTLLGQNIYLTSSQIDRGEERKSILNEAINAWIGESKQLDATDVVKLFTMPYKFNPVAGSLTQLLWAKTEYVGCAIMHSIKAERVHTYMVICNYRPTGNVEGEKVYETMRACTYNTQEYPHLCGTLRHMSDDSYEPPVLINKSAEVDLKYIAAIIFLLPLVNDYK